MTSLPLLRVEWRRRVSRRAHVLSWLPPLFFTVLSWVQVYLVSSWSNASILTFGSDHVVNTGQLIRWDAQHYLSIAEIGYVSGPCPDGPNAPENPDAICGNAAWMPLYPMMARLIALVGVPYELAGLLISEIALFGCFYLLWKMLSEKVTFGNFLLLAAVAVFPGNIYFHAWFPMSMALLGALLTVYGVQRELWWLAGLGALVAIASHSAGNVVIIALLFSPLFAWRSVTVLKRWLYGFGAAALGGLGFVWSIWLMWQATGSWTIYWDIQEESYGAGIYNPLMKIKQVLTDGTIAGPTPAFTSLQVEAIPSPRYALIAIMGFLAWALIATTIRWVRSWRAQESGAVWTRIVHSLSAVDWFLVALAIGVFFVPLVAGQGVSQFRTHVLLIPCLYLLRDALSPLKLGVVVTFAGVSTLLGAAFFTGWLV